MLDWRLLDREFDYTKHLIHYENTVLRPLFQQSLHETYVRLGLTELHQRVCPQLGYPPLTPEVVDNLLPQLNMRDRRGHTPLYCATKYATHAVKLLLDAGADIRLVLTRYTFQSYTQTVVPLDHSYVLGSM